MPFDNDFGSIGFSYNASSGSFGPSMSLGSGLDMDMSTGSVGLKVGGMLVGTSDDDSSSTRSSSSRFSSKASNHSGTSARRSDSYVSTSSGSTAAGSSSSASSAGEKPGLWAKIKSWFA